MMPLHFQIESGELHFIISTAIASSPLRKRVITMQNILISDIFTSIRDMAMSISVMRSSSLSAVSLTS